ncbi:uncharacterized protein BX664DRAFT_318469 [Halteromyces radiatus]|uniref:uncharacterized protein n=1 Tax=Halteromyces radiatus TaxID=101107 RepID=UPI00221FCA3D|nr:uncharacterized protein BX664DRAFT_318469 [Halteromyces radiatus]KAI8076733.1 hypothetical protein BX664DRAFT_318469 [Halteromyces radiatus]
MVMIEWSFPNGRSVQHKCTSHDRFNEHAFNYWQMNNSRQDQFKKLCTEYISIYIESRYIVFAKGSDSESGSTEYDATEQSITPMDGFIRYGVVNEDFCDDQGSLSVLKLLKEKRQFYGTRNKKDL